MNYLAHSENGNHITHLLRKHATGVGAIMRSQALEDSLADYFEWVGLFHDLGKYQTEFQQYLREGGRRGSVHHAICGAYHAAKVKLAHAALAIYGHHAGIPNYEDLCQHILETTAETPDREKQLCDICNTDMEGIPHEPDIKTLKTFTKEEHELFIRYLFSSLVDSDWLDTEHHFNATITDYRQSPPFDAELFAAKLEERLQTFSKEGEINRLREEVRLAALKKATLPPGFFSLALPTGLGKTLCSICWAIRHARQNKMKRIIIVLPFISIIDQTASILKSIFGEEYVLEHHSNVSPSTHTEVCDKKQLATENWDYPIIVTTSVQFFESLFSNQPARCRKVHNIRDAIVIFDEVQTLPVELIAPTLSMLKDVNRLLHTSMLFCTATQPAFEKRPGFESGIDGIEPLIEHADTLFTKTQRVDFESMNEYRPLEIDELSDFVLNRQMAALVIFNTKKKAALFYQALRDNGTMRVIHLSTTLCPAHRKSAIAQIKQALAGGEKVIVSSTQLIEAGVDLDFPSVYREAAPLESIIQSAGRCNREGRLSERGIVRIFCLKESGQPSAKYKTYTDYALMRYQGQEQRLHTADFFTDYYRNIVTRFTDPDKNGINMRRKNLEFETIANQYRLIDDSTTPLFIYRYNTLSEELYHRIKDKEFLSREDRRQMAQYSVQAYDKFIQTHKHLIGTEKAGFYSWFGTYDPALGIQEQQDLDTIIL